MKNLIKITALAVLSVMLYGCPFEAEPDPTINPNPGEEENVPVLG